MGFSCNFSLKSIHWPHPRCSEKKWPKTRFSSTTEKMMVDSQLAESRPSFEDFEADLGACCGIPRSSRSQAKLDDAKVGDEWPRGPWSSVDSHGPLSFPWAIWFNQFQCVKIQDRLVGTLVEPSNVWDVSLIHWSYVDVSHAPWFFMSFSWAILSDWVEVVGAHMCGLRRPRNSLECSVLGGSSHES